ncbi:hypothetical protein VFPPC_03626 [Pochonia chlamydosporia 170]|uniref:Uncharacterized protein n=1 Tax=Pochonia chlamydosporia 170 TaxID=1380566 RepID=A0A179G0A2_METCM|nr:hypothetical protein VFPPC_03626 [Pochonia chlamydosporia 170]OAQ71305.1 hypothetical protein VFPPC_03626 [Pochonia chlamydosporia 170]
MDGISAAASIITIWDLTTKIAHFAKSIQDAPGAWRKYADGLHAVACIQSVLQQNLDTYPHLTALTIDDDGKKRPIVEYINDRLSVVRDDASALLKRYDPTAHKRAGTKGRIFKWIVRKDKAISFVLHQTQIEHLIEAVDHAQSYLHFVLPLILMHTSESWREQSGNLLQSIWKEVRKSGTRLDELKDDGNRMRDVVLEVVAKQEESPDDASVRNVMTREQTLIVKSSKSRHFAKQAKRRVRSATKSVKESLSRASPSNGSSLHTQPHTNPANGLSEDEDADQHDSDDEFDCADMQTLQDASGESLMEARAGDDDTTEYGFVFDKETGKTFQIPLKSAGYELALSPTTNSGGIYDHISHAAATVRADEFLESLPDDQWEVVKNGPIEGAIEMATSNCCTANITDAEMMTTHSWVSLELRPKSDIFIAATVSLEACRNQESEKFLFCIERITATTEGQVFSIVVPCSVRGRLNCKHITIEVEDGPAFSQELPFRVELDSIEHVSSSSDDELDDVLSSRNGMLALFARCRFGCLHTVVEHEDHEQSGCAHRHRFNGVPRNTSVPSDDSGNDTEVAETTVPDDQTAGVSLPFQPGPGDDQDALELLRNVIFDSELPNPTAIDLNMLFKFTSLAVKYADAVGQKPSRQARHWVQSLRPSTSFDGNALTWLWIMWKLQLGAEFKTLSSIIQREAKEPISELLDLRGNPIHEAKFSDRLLNLLGAPRSVALSRVRDTILSEMELQRQYHQRGRQGGESMLGKSIVLEPSLIFGYLQLEYETWLSPQNEARHGQDFPGASFVDVRDAVLKMNDLRVWKISTLSSADKMDPRLAMLSMLIPVIGAELHVEGLHLYIDTDIKDRLVALVTELDNQDWGVDLASITP